MILTSYPPETRTYLAAICNMSFAALLEVDYDLFFLARFVGDELKFRSWGVSLSGY
jgi:hypothetical protein